MIVIDVLVVLDVLFDFNLLVGGTSLHVHSPISKYHDNYIFMVGYFLSRFLYFRFYYSMEFSFVAYYLFLSFFFFS